MNCTAITQLIETINSSQIATVVITAIAMGFSSYYVQRWVWKKSSEVRNVDRIYAPLYEELEECYKMANTFNYLKEPHSWNKIKDGILREIIKKEDERLLNDLGNFYFIHREKYNDALKILKDSILEEVKRVVKNNNIQFYEINMDHIKNLIKNILEDKDGKSRIQYNIMHNINGDITTKEYELDEKTIENIRDVSVVVMLQIFLKQREMIIDTTKQLQEKMVEMFK